MAICFLFKLQDSHVHQIYNSWLTCCVNLLCWKTRGLSNDCNLSIMGNLWAVHYSYAHPAVAGQVFLSQHSVIPFDRKSCQFSLRLSGGWSFQTFSNFSLQRFSISNNVLLIIVPPVENPTSRHTFFNIQPEPPTVGCAMQRNAAIASEVPISSCSTCEIAKLNGYRRKSDGDLWPADKLVVGEVKE